MSVDSTPDQKFFELLENCAAVSEERDPKLEELRRALQEEQMLSSITHPETGNTLLHEAVGKNNVLLVKTILCHQHSDEYLVHQKNAGGLSSLDVAAEKGDTLPEIENLLKSTIAVERAKEFVLQLFEHYSRKYDRVRKRVVGDVVSTDTHTVQGQTINAINIGSRAVGAFGMGSILNTFIDLVTFYGRKRRAKRVWKAHHQFHKLQKGAEVPKMLAKLLIRDGFEIFGSLEEHLIHYSVEDFQDWRDGRAGKMAKKCVKRMLDYIGGHSDDNMASEGHFSKSFVEGRLHGFERFKPGKLAVVDEAGIAVKEGEKGEEKLKYFRRSLAPTDTLQFRKVFEFEKREKDFLENLEEICNLTEYKFLLTRDMIDRAVREILVNLGYEKEIVDQPKSMPVGPPGGLGFSAFSAQSDGEEPVITEKMSPTMEGAPVSKYDAFSHAANSGRNVSLASDEYITKIVQDWKRCAKSGTLSNGWPQLAYRVGLAPQQVCKLRKKMVSSRMSVYDVTVLILKVWAMRPGGEPGATVGGLIDKLEGLGWTEYSRLVKNRFGVDVEQ